MRGKSDTKRAPWPVRQAHQKAAISVFRTALGRAILFALLWWMLTEGATAWWFGGGVIACAVVASLKLDPRGRWRLRPTALAGFLVFFVRHSLRGGVDVARRALHPCLPLKPAFVFYPLRLSEEGACVFLANTISLLPGTLTAELEHRVLRVHVLDIRLPVTQSLANIEARVAGLFGVPLTTANPTRQESNE